jgi:hypothetical protein
MTRCGEPPRRGDSPPTIGPRLVWRESVRRCITCYDHNGQPYPFCGPCFERACSPFVRVPGRLGGVNLRRSMQNMRPRKHGTFHRSEAGKQRLRMPGFTAEEGLRAAQGHRSGPLCADDGARVIQPQFFRRLFRGVRPVARRAAPVVGRIARGAAPIVGKVARGAAPIVRRIARSVSRSPSLTLHCTGGLCRTVWSR